MPTLNLSTAEDEPPTPPPKSARSRRFLSLRTKSTRTRQSISSELSSDESAPVATPPSPPLEGPYDAVSMRSARSNVSTGTGSLRRGVGARAASFAERMLGRSAKSKSLFDDSMPSAIPERSYQLPSPVPESFDLSISSPSPGAGSTFDFDAFPSVPQDVPSNGGANGRHTKAATDGSTFGWRARID